MASGQDQPARPMDPANALDGLRRAISDWEAAPAGSSAEYDAGERATGWAAALDKWLCEGGALPADWQTAGSNPYPTDMPSVDALIMARAQQIERGSLTVDEASQAFRLAFRALADKDTELARLKAELDRYEGRDVRHGLERYIMSSLSDGAIPPEKDGTILRATDTGTEWECQGGQWKVRERPKGRHSA